LNDQLDVLVKLFGDLHVEQLAGFWRRKVLRSSFPSPPFVDKPCNGLFIHLVTVLVVCVGADSDLLYEFGRKTDLKDRVLPRCERQGYSFLTIKGGE
jgi:hypothetical protein